MFGLAHWVPEGAANLSIRIQNAQDSGNEHLDVHSQCRHISVNDDTEFLENEFLEF
jgi:hypothetical protein